MLRLKAGRLPLLAQETPRTLSGDWRLFPPQTIQHCRARSTCVYHLAFASINYNHFCGTVGKAIKLLLPSLIKLHKTHFSFSIILPIPCEGSQIQPDGLLQQGPWARLPETITHPKKQTLFQTLSSQTSFAYSWLSPEENAITGTLLCQTFLVQHHISYIFNHIPSISFSLLRSILLYD